MQKRNLLWMIAAIIISFVPLFYLLAIWSRLPATVSLHYNSEGQPDRYGTKSSLIWVTVLLSVVALVSYFLLHYLRAVDPKVKPSAPASRFNHIGFVIVVFLSLASILMLMSARSGQVQLPRFLPTVLGVFIACLGNYMINIRPNYFVGFRLPWTLSSDWNWRKTHQLGGKLWFAGGLLFAVASLFLPQPVAMKAFSYTIIVLALIPAAYSFMLFRKANQS